MDQDKSQGPENNADPAPVHRGVMPGFGGWKMLRGDTEAETCRLNGWQVGTVLVGDEGYGPEKIKITAIGESLVLAKRIENTRGEQVEYHEGTWTFSCREWKSA